MARFKSMRKYVEGQYRPAAFSAARLGKAANAEDEEKAALQQEVTRLKAAVQSANADYQRVLEQGRENAEQVRQYRKGGLILPSTLQVKEAELLEARAEAQQLRAELRAAQAEITTLVLTSQVQTPPRPARRSGPQQLGASEKVPTQKAQLYKAQQEIKRLTSLLENAELKAESRTYTHEEVVQQLSDMRQDFLQQLERKDAAYQKEIGRLYKRMKNNNLPIPEPVHIAFPKIKN